MSEGDDSSDKPHEASQRKLDEARRKGELPKLADLTATAALAGLLLLALLPGGWAPERIGRLGRGLLEQADEIGMQLLGGGVVASGTIIAETAYALLPVALLPFALVVALLVAFNGVVFAASKLEPKLSRISPLANAKQKFGPAGLFEFGKNFVKLLIYTGLLWLYIGWRLPRLMGGMALSPGQVAAELLQLTFEYLLLVLMVMAVIGGLDHLFQRFDHARRQRMSHRELREDHRQSEGDPHFKQARRARATAIASNRMLAEVPKASVVIMNPTHYAVALKWSMEARGAPVCVAKGADAMALKIRDLAQESGVPLRYDPPTARALHASVEPGEEIRPEHFAAVAAAIRFAEEMRKKARQSPLAPQVADRRAGNPHHNDPPAPHASSSDEV